jgi:hypothetical protein
VGKKVKKFMRKLEKPLLIGAGLATGGLAGAAIVGGGMLAKKALNPDVPQPPDAPDPAPVADDQASLISNERAMARRRKGGRGSTILSESSKLG